MSVFLLSMKAAKVLKTTCCTQQPTEENSVNLKWLFSFYGRFDLSEIIL